MNIYFIAAARRARKKREKSQEVMGAAKKSQDMIEILREKPLKAETSRKEGRQ